MFIGMLEEKPKEEWTSHEKRFYNELTDPDYIKNTDLKRDKRMWKTERGLNPDAPMPQSMIDQQAPIIQQIVNNRRGDGYRSGFIR